MLKIPVDTTEALGTLVTTDTGAVLDVRKIDRFSVSAVIDVNTPSAKTFDSEAFAVLVDQSLTYTALAAGTAGNSITIRLLDPAANNQALDVTVSSLAITVSLATDGGGAITSTGDEVKAAVNADPEASLLVLVTGSNGSVVTALAATPLAGGVNSEVEEDGVNTVRIPSHGLPTGLKGQLTTTGTLPAGLSLATDYFVIASAAGYVKFASSLANAQAGTAVTITTEGAGVHTFTPTAIAGGAIKLQKSNHSEVLEPEYTYDSTHWTDVAAATAITVDGTAWFEVTEPAYRAAVVHVTLTAGSADVTLRTIVKES